MYIAEIDDILDQTLDKYMYTWIIENKYKELINIDTIINEPNFVKFQKDINKTLDYLDTLDATKKNSTHSTQQTSEDTQKNNDLNNGWDVIMLATANKIISNTTTYNKTLDIDIPITPEQEKETKQTLKLEKITSATTASAYIVKNNYIDKILNLFKVCNNNMQHGKLSSNNHETYALDQQWFTLQQQDNWFALSQDPIKQREIWSTTMSQSHT